MARKITILPQPKVSNLPVCALFDALELGQSAALNNGVTRDGALIELVGYRRYRLKVVQLTGDTSSDFRILDVPFNRVIANVFENVLLGTVVAGTRAVFNFGEGTAIFQNFMGTWLDVQIKNNGATPATYELELFAQG